MNSNVRNSVKIILSAHLFVGLLFTASLDSQAASGTDTEYRVQFLESVGGNNSYARDINNNLEIVGYSDTSVQTQHATLWTNFQPTALQTLGGSNSQANAINENGSIAGWSVNNQNDARVAQWNQFKVALDLGSLNNTGSRNTNLNNIGTVVGNDGTHATIFSNVGSSKSLPNIYGSFSNAMAINDKNEIVGAFVDNSKGAYYAGVWVDSTLVNLGSLGGNGSWAFDINESGQIAGWARRSDGYVHASTWNNSQIKDLGTLGGDFSFAYGINNHGQVVGMSSKVGVFDTFATLWDGTSIINLNDYLNNEYAQEGWTLTQAREINDLGWIVGDAYNSRLNLTKGFVMSVSAVPEPESYALFLAGLGLIAALHKRNTSQRV